jgi:hypothetical protein
MADAARPVLERVLARLQAPTPLAQGKGYRSVCPAHADAAPGSLWIGEADDGSVLLRCKRQCALEAICDRLGIAVKDLRAAPAAAEPPPIEIAGTPLVSETAEQAVLAALLMDPTAIALVRPLLQPDDFARTKHAHLYRAILAMADKGTRPDPLTLAHELKETRTLDAAGGLDYLAFLADAMPTAANVEYHARLVLERAQRRALVERLERDTKVLKAGGLPAADVAGALASALTILTHGSGTASRFRVYDDVELEQLPDLAWLVEALLPASSLAAMFGAPGSGKTFVALDLAMQIATGQAFLEHATLRGGVLYLAAEGSAGLRRRVRAWKAAHNRAGERLGLQLITEAPNLLMAADVEHILRAAAARPGDAGPPAPLRLIVIDTLARSMPGGDENSTEDMSTVIEHADRLRRASGATVLLVHHARKDNDVERGSTALRGGVDTLLLVKNEDGERALLCEKQKDGEPFAEIPLRLEAAHESCIVRIGHRAAAGPTQRERGVLATLASTFAARGATHTEWKAAAAVPDRTFYRAVARLQELGLIQVEKRGSGTLYRATTAGQAELTLVGGGRSGTAAARAGHA